MEFKVELKESNNHLYVVTGRVCDDDDDTAYIVEAKDEDNARKLYAETLRHDHHREAGDVEVFINDALPLQSAIDRRIK